MKKTPSVVILASGSAQRWEGLEHKQLALVDGEPLLCRTLRQLADRLDVRPVVITHHPQIALSVADQAEVLELPPGSRRWIADSALASRGLWGDPTLLLAGDVFWTEEAMDIACGMNSGGPLRYLITRASLGDDILGVWFRRRHRNQFATALQHAVRHAEQGANAKLWQSYRSLCGFPLTRHQLEGVHCVRIEDESTDFDSLGEYRAFIKQRGSCAA
ncbi:MAG: NTP transferase domain-containing protein [Planctomycetales bacterium]|nr:NTP transferase domain-containing protein [Planctomycetales bacterium]